MLNQYLIYPSRPTDLRAISIHQRTVVTQSNVSKGVESTRKGGEITSTGIVGACAVAPTTADAYTTNSPHNYARTAKAAGSPVEGQSRRVGAP